MYRCYLPATATITLMSTLFWRLYASNGPGYLSPWKYIYLYSIAIAVRCRCTTSISSLSFAFALDSIGWNHYLSLSALLTSLPSYVDVVAIETVVIVFAVVVVILLLLLLLNSYFCSSSRTLVSIRQYPQYFSLSTRKPVTYELTINYRWTNR